MHVRGFFMIGQLFEPEPEGMPVDERDDAQGDEGEPEAVEQQVETVHWLAGAGKCADKEATVILVIVYADIEPVGRNSQAEIEMCIVIDERRYVKILPRAQVKATSAEMLAAHQIWLHFPESVAHLRHTA